MAYKDVFSDIVSAQLVVGNMLMKKLKVREKLRERLPDMNFDKLDLYDFKQLTYRMYGVEPEGDVIQTVH